MNRDHELSGIEVLRFICAFAVLFWHYQHFFFSGAFVEVNAEKIRNALPMYALFKPVYLYGFWAVQVFWLISGFIFYRQYANAIINRSIGLSDFVIRRFSRLYPLHFITLLLVALGQAIYFSSHGKTFIYQNHSGVSFVSQLLFASNWFSWQTYSFNGPIWSISVEILVYVVFFGIVRTLGSNMLVALFGLGISWILFHWRWRFAAINPDVFLCGIYFFAGGAFKGFTNTDMSNGWPDVSVWSQ